MNENMLRYVEYMAQEYNVRLNPYTYQDIVDGLERNRQKYQTPLCPCRFYSDIDEEKRTRKNICPCKEFRTTSHCHCNLFIPKETNVY